MYTMLIALNELQQYFNNNLKCYSFVIERIYLSNNLDFSKKTKYLLEARENKIKQNKKNILVLLQILQETDLIK